VAATIAVLDFVRESNVALMPLGVLVNERFFAVAAVPERLVGGDFADVEPGVGAEGGGVEDDVDFFEAAVAGFGVEEVDDGKGGEVAVDRSQ